MFYPVNLGTNNRFGARYFPSVEDAWQFIQQNKKNPDFWQNKFEPKEPEIPYRVVFKDKDAVPWRNIGVTTRGMTESEVLWRRFRKGRIDPYYTAEKGKV